MKIKDVFRGIGKLISKIASPIQNLIQRIIIGKSVEGIKEEAKSRFLAYLITEYEDKAVEKIREVTIKIFDAVEQAVAVLPDAIEKEVLAPILELEQICVAFIGVLHVRVEELAKDGKLTDSEIDEIIAFTATTFIDKVFEWFEKVKKDWGIEEGISETDSKFSYIAELKKKHGIE